MIVVAPELPGALDLIATAASDGVVVAIGHTDATYAEATAGFDRGARAATHLFNGMRPFHHRDPGPAGAALAAPRVTAEIIADGIHVHPAALRLAHAAKGPRRLALITDAMQAAGLEDGDYLLGDQTVTVTAGEARTASGSLAGSTLTMDRAVRVCVEDAGIPLIDALQMASTTPAELLGIGAVAGRHRAGRRRLARRPRRGPARDRDDGVRAMGALRRRARGGGGSGGVRSRGVGADRSERSWRQARWRGAERGPREPTRRGEGAAPALATPRRNVLDMRATFAEKPAGRTRSTSSPHTGPNVDRSHLRPTGSDRSPAPYCVGSRGARKPEATAHGAARVPAPGAIAWC